MKDGIEETPLKPTTTDDRRRIVMPEGCPAHAPVVIEELTKDAWIVRRITSRVRAVVLLPVESVGA